MYWGLWQVEQGTFSQHCLTLSASTTMTQGRKVSSQSVSHRPVSSGQLEATAELCKFATLLHSHALQLGVTCHALQSSGLQHCMSTVAASNYSSSCRTCKYMQTDSCNLQALYMPIPVISWASCTQCAAHLKRRFKQMCMIIVYTSSRCCYPNTMTALICRRVKAQTAHLPGSARHTPLKVKSFHA